MNKINVVKRTSHKLLLEKEEELNEINFTENQKYNPTESDFFRENEYNNENDQIKEENITQEIQTETKDKISKILSNLYKSLELNKINKINLIKQYEELFDRQNLIENTLYKIKSISKTKQKKYSKNNNYIPLKEFYYYSNKKTHFYYILLDIIEKSRKKSTTKELTKPIHKNNKKIELKELKEKLRENNRNNFTKEEDQILQKLILYSGSDNINWSKISFELNQLIKKNNSILANNAQKNSLQCYIRSIELSNFYDYKKWSEKEDLILQKSILYYGPKNWQQISYCLDGRNNSQCYHRWMKGINPKIKRTKWTFEEDLTLGISLKIYGNKKWSKIANHLPGRTDIQCRERYCNILDPNLEELEWKEEEDIKLICLYEKYGSKWSKIAKEFGNRTDNTCWRRWKYIELFGTGNSKGENENINNITHTIVDTNSDFSGVKTLSSKKNVKKKRFFLVTKNNK